MVPYIRDPLVHEYYEQEFLRLTKDRNVNASYFISLADNGRRGDSASQFYWHIELTNTGRSLLKNIHVTVPNAKAVRFSVGYPNSPLSTAMPVVIGEMMPRSRRILHAWSGWVNVGSDELVVVHEAGHATTRLYRPAHPFFVTISEMWVPLLLMWLMVIAMLTLFINSVFFSG